MTTTSLLLVRPAPMADEALTSWVARLAWDNGYVCAHQLLKTMGRPVSSFLDLDQHVPAHVLDFLVRATGQSERAIHQMTLGTAFGNEETVSSAGWHAHWCLHRTFRSRQTMTPRTSVCCLCLQCDVRYLRKSWRLSWVTRCALHDCMLQDSCSLCGVVVETGLLRQRSVCLCEECGAQFRAEQSDTGDFGATGDGLQWGRRSRDTDWLERLLQTVPLATLKDLLDARMDRWFFHTELYLMEATAHARHSLETLSRHPPSRTPVGRMHVQERDVLCSLIEQAVQPSGTGIGTGGRHLQFR